MVTLGRKLNSDFLSASKSLHPKTICLLLPHFALFLLWVGKPFLPPAREACHCLLTLPGVPRIEPRTVQQLVPPLWLRWFSLPALADTGQGVLNQPFLHWPQCSACVFLTSSHGVVYVWQSAIVFMGTGMLNSVGHIKTTHWSQADKSPWHSFPEVKIVKNWQEENTSAWGKRSAWQDRDSAQPPEHCSAGAAAMAVESHFAHGF